MDIYIEREGGIDYIARFKREFDLLLETRDTERERWRIGLALGYRGYVCGM